MPIIAGVIILFGWPLRAPAAKNRLSKRGQTIPGRGQI